MDRRPLAALGAALLLFAANAVGAAEPPPDDRELAANALQWMSQIFAVPTSAACRRWAHSP